MAAGTLPVCSVPRQASAPAGLDSLTAWEVAATIDRNGHKHNTYQGEMGRSTAKDEITTRPVAHRPRLLVYSAGPALERSRPLLRRLEDAGIEVLLRTDQDLATQGPDTSVPKCCALLVLWSQFFHGAAYEARLHEISAEAAQAGAKVLNDVEALIEMQDRRWLLRKLREHGVPTPEFVECSRDGGQRPHVEERDDCVLVEGQLVRKPFVEKPVDRRDREIYVYFPKEAGGGRALVSTTESGALEYICSFDTAGNVRREGSFIYQEYLQSEGFVVQTVCVGGLVYGNAVLSGIVSSSQSSPDQSVSVRTGGKACAVWLRQEEKVIASKLKEVFHQTLFGITFARSQTADRQATSFVTDVWPGLPRTGLGTQRDDAVRALLAEFAEQERWELRTPRLFSSGMRRSQSLIYDSPQLMAHAWPPGIVSGIKSKSMSLLGSAGIMEMMDLDAGADKDRDLVCVLLLARHGDRTPKQKVKAKIKLESEFAAGWLCGWLADSSTCPPLPPMPTTFELRTPCHLQRLMRALQQLQSQGYNTGSLIDALSCITKEGLACHAKVGADGATVVVNLKWGGELTSVGVDEAEALGWLFRSKTFPGEDIDELHATLRHDVKIYASKEPRCQETAAAFSKGLLRLDSPLPPIIAALVRTDEFRCQDGARNYVEKKEPKGLLPLDKSWEEVESLAGPCVSPALKDYDTSGPALEALRKQLQDLQQALQEGQECTGPLHKGETYSLLLERYKDALGELGSGDALHLHKVPDVLDHLQYDCRHNRKALPARAAALLSGTLHLAEALCDVVVPLEAAMEQRTGAGAGSAYTGRSILTKLRWDLRVASGADLGEETAHLNKHEALYTDVADGAVRTRLYFGHNSWLRGLLQVLFCTPGTSCGCGTDEGRPPGLATPEQLNTRLGFLSHVTVRLWREKLSGELRVSFDFAHSGSQEPIQLFELPLATVDAWWSSVIKGS